MCLDTGRGYVMSCAALPSSANVDCVSVAVVRPSVMDVLNMPYVRRHLGLYLDWARNVPQAHPQVRTHTAGLQGAYAGGLAVMGWSLCTPAVSCLTVCMPNLLIKCQHPLLGSWNWTCAQHVTLIKGVPCTHPGTGPYWLWFAGVANVLGGAVASQRAAGAC